MTNYSKRVMLAALRLARNRVKDAIKQKGHKLSHIPAKEITAAAEELLKQRPEIFIEAARSIEGAN